MARRRRGRSLVGLGATRLDMKQIQDIAITGGVAAGGAIVIRKGMSYLAPLVKMNPATVTWRLIEMGGGVLVGYIIGKVAKKPEIGAAVAIGPIVFNGAEIIGKFLAPSLVPGMAGARRRYSRQVTPRSRPALGRTIPESEWPPKWLSSSEEMAAWAQQYPGWGQAAVQGPVPAWTMG